VEETTIWEQLIGESVKNQAEADARITAAIANSKARKLRPRKPKAPKKPPKLKLWFTAFIAPPIDFAWLGKAHDAGALEVACLLWWVAGISGGRTSNLYLGQNELFRIASVTKARQLKRLAAAGLATAVKGHHGGDYVTLAGLSPRRYDGYGYAVPQDRPAFIWTPIDLTWLGKAAANGALAVGVLLWRAVDTQRRMENLELRRSKALTVASETKALHLTKLEKAGLIAVDQRPGRAPIVSLLGLSGQDRPAEIPDIIIEEGDDSDAPVAGDEIPHP
jgi:hypothetical protein